MEYYYTIFLVLLPIIFIFFLNQKESKLPPGPKPWPIIGNIHQLGKKPHRTVTQLSRVYGPLMSLKLGSITTIVISSSDVAREMFLKHDLELSGRNVPDAGRVANHDEFSIGWLPVCPKWRKLRKVSTLQLFTNKRLHDTRHLREKVVGELVEYAKDCCQRGRAMDICKAGFTTSINLLSNTFFSIDLTSYVGSNSPDFKDFLVAYVEEGGRPNVSDVFPMVRWFDLQGVRRKVGGCFEKMMGVFEEIIEERLRDPKGYGDDVLANLLKLVQENELDIDDVKHLLFDLFIAGTDTTSATLEWTMTELLRHPEKMAEAQTEIDKVVGKDGSIQESNVLELPYLQAIVKETLRMYPPAPFLLPHKAEKDVELCGYFVPKQTQVWVNVWSIGRDQSLWQNPNSFEPERFLDKEIDVKVRDFMFIPFGEGRRICPGMPLAYRMVQIMLANFLYSFNWKLVNVVNPQDIDVEEKFGIVLQRVVPLQAIPLSR